jgi:hypothetical protein
MAEIGAPQDYESDQVVAPGPDDTARSSQSAVHQSEVAKLSDDVRYVFSHLALHRSVSAPDSLAKLSDDLVNRVPAIAKVPDGPSRMIEGHAELVSGAIKQLLVQHNEVLHIIQSPRACRQQIRG